ncbi:YciI family protein [Nostocoides sp. F2B08]|uniref:YciI family protein n=1 Tax=Nostocoides sp. F2B08 TaxID=2653936 RepID=UPI00186AECB5|nr:YciI family protein [Tetrasphaera sp. F2B08]
MTRVPNVPEAFDVYTVVVLRRPDDAPELPDDELEDLQTQHLAYRAELTRQGALVANGPFGDQSDPTYRGMSVFACGPDEAARLSEADPSVQAGRLSFDVMEWWVAEGSLAFPRVAGAVGSRRTMPD